MKYLTLLSFVSWLFAAAACSTNRGGTNPGYQSSSDTVVSPIPTGSPSQRPGMTPEDPRDPQFITRPQPLEPPPTTKP